MRAENLAACTTVSSFILISGDVPVFVDIPEFLVCDDAILDGFTEFNLDSQTPIIDDGDPDLLVTYHLDPADAEDGSNILASPYTNTVNPETLYVRVIDNSTGCYIVFEMDLKVITPVAVVPDDLLACDEVPNDGFAEFNLRDRDDQISINDPVDTFVKYYLTEADADAESNTGPLTSPYENTTPNTQTVFARLENSSSGCFGIVALILQIETTNPTITCPIDAYAAYVIMTKT